jgi:hypothetical protein
LAQDYFVTLADDQNVKITDHWDGVDFTVNARPKTGLEEAQYLEFTTGTLGVPTALRWWRRSGYSRSWSLERSGWIGSTSSTSAFQKSSGLASRGRT